MQLRHKQRGLGWFGLLYIFGTLGLIVLIGLKVYPIYLNEMKLARAVTRVAAEFSPNTATESPDQVKSALQKWWNVEDIEIVSPKDVKVQNLPTGKVLAYDYWNQVEVYKNIYISFHFTKEAPLKGAD